VGAATHLASGCNGEATRPTAEHGVEVDRAGIAARRELTSKQPARQLNFFVRRLGSRFSLVMPQEALLWFVNSMLVNQLC
jgi:hypothetical protein